MMREDLWNCSHKIESVSLQKCPYDQWLTNKAYLSAITVTSIFRSFAYKMAAKTGWHRHGTKFRHCNPMHTSPNTTYIHRESKKQDTQLLAITSLTIVRFSKFFSLADSVVNLQQIPV